MISELYVGTMHNYIYTVNGIDICYPFADFKRNYKAEIYDFGSTPESEMDFNDFDIVFFIDGTTRNKITMIYTTQLPLNGVNYTVGINFSDKAAFDKNMNYLMLNLN